MDASARIPSSNALSQQKAERMLADVGLSPHDAPEDDHVTAAPAEPGSAGHHAEALQELAEVYLDPFGALSLADEEPHEALDTTRPQALPQPADAPPTAGPPRERPPARTEASTGQGTLKGTPPRHATDVRGESARMVQRAEAWPKGETANADASAINSSPGAPSWADDPEYFAETDDQATAPPQSPLVKPGGGPGPGAARPRLVIAGRLGEPRLGWVAVGLTLILAGVLAGLLLAGRGAPATTSGPKRAAVTPTQAASTRPRRAVEARQHHRHPRRRRHRHNDTVPAGIQPAPTRQPAARVAPSPDRPSQAPALPPAQTAPEPIRAARPLVHGASHVAASAFGASRVAIGEFGASHVAASEFDRSSR